MPFTLHSETGLNGGFRAKGPTDRLLILHTAVGLSATALTGGRSVLPHLGGGPDRQRAPAFERLVEGMPVRRLVGHGEELAHTRQLSR